MPTRYDHADPREEPPITARGPVSGDMIEWVDKRTYDRVIAALQERIIERQTNA